jgi:hypothetical protein
MFQLGIRRAGTLTNYLFDHVIEGDFVGIRGPLGNGFPVELFEGQDVLLVAGGLGMVPLRGLLHYLIDQRDRFARCCSRHTDALLGALPRRTESLARRGDAEILLSVDSARATMGAGSVVTDCSTGLVRRRTLLRPPSSTSSCSRNRRRGFAATASSCRRTAHGGGIGNAATAPSGTRSRAQRPAFSGDDQLPELIYT